MKQVAHLMSQQAGGQCNSVTAFSETNNQTVVVDLAHVEDDIE